MTFSDLLPILFSGGGILVILFAALRFQREDAGQIVKQVRAAMAAMKDLIDELEEALQRCRAEVKRVRTERDRYRRELDELRKELGR